MTSSIDTTIRTASQERWPAIQNPPYAPIRAALARVLLGRIAGQVPVSVALPDASLLGGHEPGWPTIEIVNDSFFHRLGSDLHIGLGEAYMAGDWRPGEGSDLADVLTPFAERLRDIVPAPLQKLRRLVDTHRPPSEENHREGARSNIARHYDLSNDLFTLFLDETLTYSSALFEDDPWASGFEELAAAQRRKVDRVLDIAGVTSGTSVLEIGTGWGQLALQAAQRGAFVHSVTLSQEQLALAQRRVDAAGVSERVRLELRDYRDVEGTYDAVVSVEMIEAVGPQYWSAYFASVGDRLRPGGRFGLQAITMAHDRLLAVLHAQTWVSKYVFPGGQVPSAEVIRQHGLADGRMRVVEEVGFGSSYARTLRLWRERFLSERTAVRALGFDETFERLWEFYLAHAEAGFRSGQIDVRQFTLEKTG